ncbi:hypothetical protein ACIBQ1_09915 [Nonomuraea sp. NPDC050153]|uniref:hypothetical protein n=1 Tax=Nonomuraea sp. NPDC050153 TaxID=3364359 RepID=UPI0037B46A8C
MAGTPLAEAFVRVRALTDKFKDDIRDGLKGAGDDFGRQFSREVSASLRGERDAFETEGEQIGDASGTAAGREFADRMKDNGVRFGDDASPFVAVGRKLGAQVGDAAGKEFAKAMGKQAGEGFSQALDPIRRFELQLAQAELAARRAGLASAEAGERAEAASKRAAEAAAQVAKGEGDKEEATRLAAAAAREQEKAEIAATNAALAKVTVSQRAAQVSQAYATAQADASRETDRLGDGVRRLNPDLDRSGSSMSGLLGVAKSLSGAFAGVAASLAKVGAGAAAFSALGAGAASAAGYTIELAAALAPLSGLLAGLPGIALTGAAAFSVWKLATSGLGKAFKEALAGDFEAFSEAIVDMSDAGKAFALEFWKVAGSLREFQSQVQGDFLAELSGRLNDWASAALTLQPAVSGLAREFGGLVRAALDFATSGPSLASFNSILGGTRDLVAAIRGALDPLLRGFVDLGVVGNQWLAGFSGSLRDVLTTFGQWMSEVSRSGQALAWLNDAAGVLRQLGTLVKDVWQTFTGLLDAAAAAGGNALGVLGSLAGAMNEWVNSAKGQEVLVEIFRALQDIGRALLPVITSLAGAVAEIAPHAAKVATALGPVLADAIGVLGTGIAALGPGLVKMVESFGRMVAAIGPLEPLGRAVGDIFAALGEALALIVPEVAKIALALAPALATAIRALAPALAALGPGLVAVAEYLGDAFANPAFVDGLLAIGKGLADVLVAAAPLLPLIAQLAGILGQVLGGALTNLGTALRPIIEALGAALRPALDSISNALNLLIPLMPPIYQAFGEIGAALITQLLPPILDLIPALVNALIPAMAEFARQLQPLIPLLADLAVQLIQQVLPAILPILPQLTELSLALARLGLTLAQLVADAAPYIQAIIAIFQHLYDVLVGNSIIPDLINAIRDWWQKGVDWVKSIVSWFGDLPGLMSGWLGGVLGVVQHHWDNIRNAISDRVGQARDTISRTLDDVGTRWSQGWSNVQNIVHNAWNSIRNAVTDGANNVLNVVRSLPGWITGALGDLSGLLYGSGASLLQGLINGMWSMFNSVWNTAVDILNRIRSLFPFSPAKEGPFSGKGWTLYSGQSLISGFAEGVRQQEGELTSAMDQVMRAGAAALAPALPTLAGPSVAPEFSGAFGAPVTGGGVAAAAPRVINVENITLQGVLDPTNPVSYRRMVERLREAIRELEREVYASG